MTSCSFDKKTYDCDNLSNYVEYEANLFAIFHREYNDLPNYNSTPIRMKHYPPQYDEKSGFYHLICENYNHTKDERDRKPNLERAKRILWPKSMLKNCLSDVCFELKIWENKRNGKTNVLIFCTQLDYLIVLSKREGYMLLTTAYPVDQSHRKRKLLKEYEAYKKQTTPST